MASSESKIIGWREWVGLPALGVPSIKVKVDTGAKTSALHAYYVERFERNGVPWVKFGLHPVQRDKITCVECEAPIKDIRAVTDSGGHSEQRVFIETQLLIKGISMIVEVTLTDRETMRFRMLLGRNVLKRGFLVDSAQSFLLGGDPAGPPVSK